MIVTNTAFPVAQPLAIPWLGSRACPLGPPGLKMSPGWERRASRQLWVPSPHLGCPWYLSKSPDADSSHGAVLRQNTQQLGKAFHLVNLLWEVAGASSELTARPSFQTCCFAPGGLFARSRCCCGSCICWIHAVPRLPAALACQGARASSQQHPKTHRDLGGSARSDPACTASLCPRGHCGDVLICLAGEPCPQLWDEDLVGDKYENITGKESPSHPADEDPVQP